MSDQKQIHEIILEGFHNSAGFLANFFGMEKPDPQMLIQYVKVQTALRALPREAMEEVVRPILTAQFKAYGLNPHNPNDRALGAELTDIMAVAIQDATAMIMHAMEHQGRASELIRTGRANRILT